MLTKIIIISGGQKGVDEAALDAAKAYGIKTEGWCPKGRINEIGKIPEKYNFLTEVSGMFNNPQENYDLRTRKNINYSDGTLILVPKIPLPSQIKDGTLLTIEEANKQQKPFLIIDLSKEKNHNTEKVIKWLKENSIKRLNIGGPRESSSKGIYDLSFHFLTEIFKNLLTLNLNPKPRL